MGMRVVKTAVVIFCIFFSRDGFCYFLFQASQETISGRSRASNESTRIIYK